MVLGAEEMISIAKIKKKYSQNLAEFSEFVKKLRNIWQNLTKLDNFAEYTKSLNSWQKYSANWQIFLKRTFDIKFIGKYSASKFTIIWEGFQLLSGGFSEFLWDVILWINFLNV